MKARDIPQLRSFLSDIILAEPVYSRAKYFNKLYNLYNEKQKRLHKLWENKSENSRS